MKIKTIKALKEIILSAYPENIREEKAKQLKNFKKIIQKGDVIDYYLHDINLYPPPLEPSDHSTSSSSSSKNQLSRFFDEYDSQLDKKPLRISSITSRLPRTTPISTPLTTPISTPLTTQQLEESDDPLSHVGFEDHSATTQGGGSETLNESDDPLSHVGFEDQSAISQGSGLATIPDAEEEETMERLFNEEDEKSDWFTSELTSKLKEEKKRSKEEKKRLAEEYREDAKILEERLEKAREEAEQEKREKEEKLITEKLEKEAKEITEKKQKLEAAAVLIRNVSSKTLEQKKELSQLEKDLKKLNKELDLVTLQLSRLSEPKRGPGRPKGTRK